MTRTVKIERVEVDSIASGYEWDCPSCDALNVRPSWKEEDECFNCGQFVRLRPPEHAIE